MPSRIITLRLVSYNSHNLNSCWTDTHRWLASFHRRSPYSIMFIPRWDRKLSQYITHKIRDTARRRVEIFAYDSITEYRAVAEAINKSFLLVVSTVPRTFNFVWKNPIFNPIVIKFLERSIFSTIFSLHDFYLTSVTNIKNIDFIFSSNKSVNNFQTRSHFYF